MKRTVQMKTGGVPVAGMRAKNFKGWRKSSAHWVTNMYPSYFKVVEMGHDLYLPKLHPRQPRVKGNA